MYPDELWTAEQTNALHDLLGGTPKLSASEITSLLNSRFRHSAHGLFTRNAVIAKIHRMGWAPSKQPKPAGAKPPKKKKRKRKPKLKVPPHLPAAPPPPPRAEHIPTEQRRSVYELTARSCRWPIGDPAGPGFFFCGGVTVEGRPYCAGHLGVAYSHTKMLSGPPRKQRFPAAVPPINNLSEGESDGQRDPDQGPTRSAEGDAQSDGDQGVHAEGGGGVAAAAVPAPTTDQ